VQYQVPQFIEVEDKIFGPLTLKQFIWLAGGGGVCLVFFTLLPFFLFVALSIPVIVFAAGLAFYTINGRPLIVAVEHAFSYFFGSKLYLWKQGQGKVITKQEVVAPAQNAGMVPKLSASKLRDLSWSLNIKDRTQSGGVSRDGLAL
jgi:hypothetical protein